MTTNRAIEVANKMQLSDNPLWLEVKRFAFDYEKQIAELEAQIEKMKCCGNCDFFNYRFEACYYDKECKNKDHWKLRR